MLFAEKFLNRFMNRRSFRIMQRLQNELNQHNHLLDLGCGTGHNTRMFKEQFSLKVTSVDRSYYLKTPELKTFSLCDAHQLPFKDNIFDIVFMGYMLHYSKDPKAIIEECKRVCSNKIIIFQSVYSNNFAKNFLELREFFYGRGAFEVCKKLNLIPKSECYMKPKHFFHKNELENLITSSAWNITKAQEEFSSPIQLSRTCFILEKN